MSSEITRELPTANGHGEVEVDPPGGPGISIFESLRAEVDERASDEHLLLPVPGWNERLLARYGVLGREALTPLIERAQRSGAGALSQDTDLDLLARALESLYVVEGDQRIRLEDGNGEPIRFDERLADLLPGAPREGGSRAVIRALFHDNALALGGHVMKLVGWMQDTSAQVEGAISEGE